MSVLICDSNCELWYTYAEELGIPFISMPYIYRGEEECFYDLGKQTDFKAFYTAVRGGAVPRTMALNPENYKDILRPYFERGEDVFYISFSHAMSGTFGSLDLALKDLAEEFPERKCTVFDTKAISLGAGLQVEAAARLKKDGASDEELLAFLEEFRGRVGCYFEVDDLMHLKRGGRLSAAAAVAGTMLGLKPILTFNEEGGLSVYERAMGRKKAMRMLAEHCIKEMTAPEYPVYVLDADCEEEGDRLAALIKEKRPEANIRRQPVGPVIGSHCGPGTLAVLFIGDRRPIPLK